MISHVREEINLCKFTSFAYVVRGIPMDMSLDVLHPEGEIKIIKKGRKINMMPEEETTLTCILLN